MGLSFLQMIADYARVKQRVAAFEEQIGKIILGKKQPIRLAISCLLAGGHLLVEDIPGVGKTTLSHAIARSMGLEFRRIQFTSDLLPADVTGNSIFDRESGTFVFHPGPLFSQVVLVDEVNRATPKTQSALLEAMEEGQISIDGKTHALPDPFFVIATQNPQHQIGTFPLPESQLDRFLMRIEIGVPDRAAERTMLLAGDMRRELRAIEPVLSPEDLRSVRDASQAVHASSALLDYVQDLLDESRRLHQTGLSPRAGLALLRAARAWAWLEDRNMVLPEDVQAVAMPVMAHRLGHELSSDGAAGRALVEKLLRTVAVP